MDEVYLKIDGRLVYLWCAVDAEGEILGVLVQSKRDKHAAAKLMRKLLKKYGLVPDRLITDDLRSYGAAALSAQKIAQIDDEPILHAEHGLREAFFAACSPRAISFVLRIAATPRARWRTSSAAGQRGCAAALPADIYEFAA